MPILCPFKVRLYCFKFLLSILAGPSNAWGIGINFAGYLSVAHKWVPIT